MSDEQNPPNGGNDEQPATVSPKKPSIPPLAINQLSERKSDSLGPVVQQESLEQPASAGEKDTPDQGTQALETKQPTKVESLPITLLPLPAPANRFTTVRSSTVTPTEVQTVVGELECRLRKCEDFVGPRQPDPLPKRSMNNATGAVDWYSEVRNALVRSNMSQQVRKLHKLTDQLFHGRVAEFEKKYEIMKVWLEAENADITSVMLTQQAKRSYILEHEQMIRNTAEQLKIVNDLKEFINPPNLTDLPSHAERLELLEARGHIIAEQALQLTRRIQELAQSYNTAMNMLAFWLKEVDFKLISARQQGAQIKKKEKQKTRVMFAVAEEDELDD